MVRKNYDWAGGAKYEEHTKKKHTILAEYFREYLITRCKLPQQSKFKVTIADCFAGSGLYECGSYGSPIIFIKTIQDTCNEINIQRAVEGLRPIYIECLLILNDANKETINLLKENTAPHLVAIKQDPKNLLTIKTHFLNSNFETIYPEIKELILDSKCRNVFFNLDQCGYSHVTSRLIKDIMTSWKSAEVILTFMIESLLTYLSQKPEISRVKLEPEVQHKVNSLLEGDESRFSKNQWVAEVEKIAYNTLKSCAPYTSPFSINNPDGWRYWLMHFANNHRARQVYNIVQHNNAKSQAHFGRAGLFMLSYDPSEEGLLYLFNQTAREQARDALHDDIPKLVSHSGDALTIEEFYISAYSETPAHNDDIHQVMIDNPDLEVVTENGGTRRSHNAIKSTDILKIKNQKSFFFMFDKVAENP